MTIRDVARLADVHPGTVSRALNEQTRGLVNSETAQRVIEAAEQLGYRPNPIARGLKTNQSFMVGALIPDLTNPLFPPIMRAIEDRLAQDGYTLLTVNTDNDPDRERRHVEALTARHVDGFIAATARLDAELLADVAAGGAPVVLVNRSAEGGSLPAVTVDDHKGLCLAVEHVVALGHSCIAHLAGPQNISTGRQRYLGFLDAIAHAGLEAPAERIAFADELTEAEGARAGAQLLRDTPLPTAILTANDRLAIGCYDALAAAGLECPRDISVVGFNDMPLVDRLHPPLTTVRIPQRELGTLAAELLLQALHPECREQPEIPPEMLAAGAFRLGRGIVLEPELIVRKSTAPPKR